MKKLAVLGMALALGVLITTSQAPLPKTPSAPGSSVYIISPADGETVPKTFSVKFGLQGMGIAPAGIPFENTGHHHLLVDVDEQPDMDIPLPATEQIIHFGKGQTETVVTLDQPGEHTLQLIFGDHLHIPHDPPLVSAKIRVNVLQ